MLKIENLKKSYKKNNVLKCVNLCVKRGEIKALVGVNGAGKSTLMDIICGVKTEDSGSITINGKNALDKKERKLLKYIVGYMPQTFNLFLDLTTEENLKYLKAVFKIRDISIVDKMIKSCHLDEKRKTLAKNLSGGYKQLLALAGALINNPKLLILDEPTSAMDPVFRKIFWDIVRVYNKKGATVFVITHHIEELLECDSFACLSEGKIIYDGGVDEFRSGDFINVKEIVAKFYNKDKV